jgi:WhiB family redox-sensing transcriptional regulator
MPSSGPACALDPSLWFATEDAAVADAKALCRECPQQVACLRGALEREEPWGVWGGQLFHRGAVVARPPRQGRSPSEMIGVSLG